MPVLVTTGLICVRGLAGAVLTSVGSTSPFSKPFSVPLPKMRFLMWIWYRSRVVLMLWIGRQTKPRLRLVDFSGLRGPRPSTLAAGLLGANCALTLLGPTLVEV